MMYSLVEIAKTNGVDYLKPAVFEAIGGCPIPLPHQLV